MPVKNIGGQYHDYKVAADPGPVYTFTEYERQKKAMRFVADNLFDTPEWLNEKEIFSRLPYSFGQELSNLQRQGIDALITRRRMSVLMDTKLDSKGKAYSLEEMLGDMDKAIFRELYEGRNVDFYRRNLQKIYVGRLIQQAFAKEEPGLIEPMSYKFYLSDMQGILRYSLKEQQKLFKRALQRPGIDMSTKIHLQELSDKIEREFEIK